MESNYIRNFQKITGQAKRQIIMRRAFGLSVNVLLFSLSSYFEYMNQLSHQTITLSSVILFEACLSSFYNAFLLNKNYKQLMEILEKAIQNNKIVATGNSDQRGNLDAMEKINRRFRSLAPNVRNFILANGLGYVAIFSYGIGALGTEQGMAWISVVLLVSTMVTVYPTYLMINKLFRVL